MIPVQSVTALHREIADLRLALRTAREVAEHERAARRAAETSAACAWRVGVELRAPKRLDADDVARLPLLT
jgi:hypothetical protein